MQRCLEIAVSRAATAHVYVLVDDDDPELSKLFAQPGDKVTPKQVFSRNVLSLLKEAAHESADLVDDYDWEQDKDETSVESVREVSLKELLLYRSWNAVTKREFCKEDLVEPSQPTEKYDPAPNQMDLWEDVNDRSTDD